MAVENRRDGRSRWFGHAPLKQAFHHRRAPAGTPRFAQSACGEQPASNPPEKVAIVANPFSGRRRNRRFVDRLVSALRSRNLEPAVAWDLQHRHRLLAAPDLAQSHRCLVSAGGDGSLREVVNELAQHDRLSEIPLAMLPLGTVNIFARHFGFTRDTDALAAAIARGRARPSDCGSAAGRLFTMMISAGFDAHVVHGFARWRTDKSSLRRVSRLSYFRHILDAIRRYDYPKVTIELDNGRISGTHLFVFNLPQYGMKLRISPSAHDSDALLDWIIFQRPGLVSMGGYVLAVLRGRHLDRSDVHHGRARRLRIVCDGPIAVQADG